ncbi:hypothetical protein B0H19DRAFT_1245730 [Mycena capillaripes]|nr:hypothetical protein B0H19DRAFT_1245730 [Mycena capillaripes]
MPPRYEILHSGEYWQTMRQNRARRLAHQGAGAPDPTRDVNIDFFPHPDIITVTSSRNTVFFLAALPTGRWYEHPNPPPSTQALRLPQAPQKGGFVGIPLNMHPPFPLATNMTTHLVVGEARAFGRSSINRNKGDSLAYMATPVVYRCEPPYFSDPGQPATPNASQKLYLVTGEDKERAGMYPSWNSAGGNSQGLGATFVKRYSARERDQLRAAWHAACNRGEHAHPPNLALAPLVASQQQNPSSPRTPTLPARLWTTSPAPNQPAPTGKRKVKIFSGDTPRASSGAIHLSRCSLSPTPTPFIPGSVPAPGLKVYAVRSPTRGWVFSDAGDAWDRFHCLQRDGQKAEFSTAPGFTRALAFAERETPDPSSDEGRRRRAWTLEESRAHEQQETELRRREILEELAYYREGESTHSSDESDVTRTTDDLEDELDLRVAHGEEWRQKGAHFRGQ